MTPEAWIALAALALTLIVALGAFATWLAGKIEGIYSAITASRHKIMSDLQPRFARFDEDLEKVEDRVSGLETRVSVLEARR